jgi:hypothetical protein
MFRLILFLFVSSFVISLHHVYTTKYKRNIRIFSTLRKDEANKYLNQNQLGFMESDECICVNDNDELVGSISKKDSHIFSETNPRGILHRAFSVFIFNHDNKLLLQQRAADKITFPEVWTNTCCSHPLVGMVPNEVDTDENIRSGHVVNIKNAAVRKLKQELGIKF